MGRLRTTGCVDRHWPGEICKTCARVRAHRSRARLRCLRKRQRDVTARSPERTELDQAAAVHRKAGARARAYITKYLKRGAIIPPDACEYCGAGQQLTRYSKVVRLHAWQPNPTRPREVAWLCTSCRKYAHAAGESVELRWQWPGTAMPLTGRGRPPKIAIDPAWIVAANTASARSKIPELAEQLFFFLFSQAAGPACHGLYRQALRETARGKLWRPTGDTRVDDILRRWSVWEYARGQARDADTQPRVVQPTPARERRPRIDHTLLLPKPPERMATAAFDKVEFDRKIALALDKLAAAEENLDALIQRMH